MKRIIPFLLLAFAFAACQDEGPIVPTDDALFDKGGNKPKSQWVPLSVTFRDSVIDGITSDGRGPYEYGECGVRAGFPPNPGGDAIVGTDRWPVRRKDSEKCGGPERRWINFDLGLDELMRGNFVNVDSVRAITGEDPVARKAVFLVKDVCTLLFDQDAYPESNNVEVWQNTDGTWTVRSRGDHVAYCKDGVRSYYLPFELTVSLVEN
ncbi:MAG: hypothetical protein ACYTA3_12325 [Planctomycetota bacterium]|jgi:hypothetical protein